jgi:hypothetical protein
MDIIILRSRVPILAYTSTTKATHAPEHIRDNTIRWPRQQRPATSSGAVYRAFTRTPFLTLVLLSAPIPIASAARSLILPLSRMISSHKTQFQGIIDTTIFTIWQPHRHQYTRLSRARHTQYIRNRVSPSRKHWLSALEAPGWKTELMPFHRRPLGNELAKPQLSSRARPLPHQ